MGSSHSTVHVQNWDRIESHLTNILSPALPSPLARITFEYWIPMDWYDTWEFTDLPDQKALSCYQGLARSGYSLGQIRLAHCYWRGTRGLPQDFDAAIQLYDSAAKQDDLEGEAWLASCLFKKQSDAQALFRLSQRGAKFGFPLAMSNLGFCYLNGIGVDKDEKEGIRLLNQSSGQGNSYGQCRLGYSYYAGLGVSKDLDKAINLFQLSANQGNYVGQYFVGFCYMQGHGVQQDLLVALRWFRLAEAQGYEEAKKAVEMVLSSLDP